MCFHKLSANINRLGTRFLTEFPLSFFTLFCSLLWYLLLEYLIKKTPFPSCHYYNSKFLFSVFYILLFCCATMQFLKLFFDRFNAGAFAHYKLSQVGPSRNGCALEINTHNAYVTCPLNVGLGQTRWDRTKPSGLIGRCLFLRPIRLPISDKNVPSLNFPNYCSFLPNREPDKKLVQNLFWR